MHKDGKLKATHAILVWVGGVLKGFAAMTTADTIITTRPTTAKVITFRMMAYTMKMKIRRMKKTAKTIL